jgi:hypothetical protein
MRKIELRSLFDEALIAAGPPAVFTVDAKGQLGLDDWRTREHYGRIDLVPTREVCHCLYRDRVTGFVQYVLLTSAELCQSHPRQDITHFPDQSSALAALAALGNPPMSQEAITPDP